MMAERILDLPELSKRISALKSQGRKVVLADGCFDLLHVGHVRFLRAAKALGDVLVLALNSDESVKRVRGAGRPLLPLEDRLGVLAAFEMVDFLTAFSEDTVEKLLGRLQPDIYARRPPAQLPPRESFGGQVATLTEGSGPTVEKVIAEILRKYGPPSLKP